MLSHDALAPAASVKPTFGMILQRFVARRVDSLRHTLCGLRGHDALLHFERNRVCLRCASCGHETPGWEIGTRKPRLRYAGDAQRYRLHQRGVLAQRVA